MKPCSHGRIPEEKLLADIRAVAEELGRTPGQRLYNKLGDHHTTTIKDRFGSWSAGVREAGLEPNEFDGDQAESVVEPGHGSLLDGVDWEDLEGVSP